MEKKLIQDYIENNNVHFYKKQKIKFAQQIISDFKEMGYQGKIVEERIRATKVRNIMIGNFKTAKTIIVVPYDSPSRIFWPNYKYYPVDGMKTMKKNFLPTYTPMILAYLLLLFFVYVGPRILHVKNSTPLFIFVMIYFIFLLIFIWKGVPSKKNVNRNNSSIISALSLANKLTKDKRKEIAFVFTDINSYKMYGSQLLDNYMKSIKKQTTKIVLYCIGSGDTIALAYQKGMRKEANTLQKGYQGTYPVIIKSNEIEDNSQLPMQDMDHAIQISSGDMQNGILCVRYSASNKDCVINELLLDNIVDMLENYVK